LYKSSNVTGSHHDKADKLSFGVNPFSAKATFLSFLTDIDKRVLYAKSQFVIDTVNIYFNREITNLYLKFMISKFKWRHCEMWPHNSPDYIASSR